MVFFSGEERRVEPIVRRRWIPRDEGFTPEQVIALSVQLGISPLTARVLAQRGILTGHEGRQFLDSRLADLPDPFLLPDMDRATERLARAIMHGERLAVHGDYDVDGITGTALLVETLRSFGADVEFHIPLRLKDGYGLSAEALEKTAAAGTRIVISVDCGISAVAEAGLAASLGIDLIITDHHHPPANLPSALAVVNPHLPGCLFPFRQLAGVGVAFFLLVGLRKVLREKGGFAGRQEPDLRHGLDLVALGTIADIVPLVGVNRILTRVGLAVLSGGSRPGMIALKEVAAVKEVTCGTVGFHLAPRLNAAGRLEDAALGVELLLGSSNERAMETARLLDGFNRERQKIENETIQQAIELLEQGQGGEYSIVLADERWHPGVIGIVASRLVERYHRPVVLVALENGQGKGSARSIGGFHLYQGLCSCEQHLQGFGGHEFAAGLSIRADQVSAFALCFEEVAAAILDPEDLLPKQRYDGELLLEELTLESVKEMAALAPFGAGNPQPTFIAAAVRAQQARIVGDHHLRFTARQGGYSLPCIAFGMAGRLGELQGDIDLLFQPALNEWQGRTSVQLQICDLRPCRPVIVDPLSADSANFPSAV
jgi:single-stranded-DNA-specific exonuclease